MKALLPLVRGRCLPTYFTRTTLGRSCLYSTASIPNTKSTDKESTDNVDVETSEALVAGDRTAVERTLQLRSYAKTLSFSRLDTYRTCARRFWFQYVEKRPTKLGNLNILLGSALHEAAAKMATHVIEKNEFPSLDVMQQSFVETWQKSVREQVLDVMSDEQVVELMRASSNTSLINVLPKQRRKLFTVDSGQLEKKTVLMESEKQQIFDQWMHMGLDVVEKFHSRERDSITIPSMMDSVVAPAHTPLMAEKLFRMSISRKVLLPRGEQITQDQQDSAVFNFLLEHGLEDENDYKRHTSFCFTGFYDRVDRQISEEQNATRPNQTVVVEYKTQLNRFSLAKNFLQLKLYIYSLGLNTRMVGNRPESGRIVSFVNGKSLPYVTMERDMEYVDRYLHSTANDILVDRNFDPIPSKGNCRYCPFRDICPDRHIED